MALLLNQPYETPHGITVSSTYWRWTGLAVDVPQAVVKCVLLAYASQDAFTNGKEAIGSRTYEITGPGFAQLVTAAPVGPTLSDVLSNACYDWIKDQDPFFGEAVKD